MKLHSVEAIVSYVFKADQLSCVRPFETNFGESLGKKLDASELGIQANAERPLWVLKNGTARLSDTRRILVSHAVGNANELTVRVSGETSDGVDVLNYLWELLNPDRDVEALHEIPGTMAYMTTAVATLAEECTTLIPLLATILEAARANLGSRLVEAVKDDVKFRLDVPLRIAIGGIIRDRSITIEPRFTSTSADRVYFTSSPFTSDEHQAMLEKIETLVTRR